MSFREPTAPPQTPLLEVRNLRKFYPARKSSSKKTGEGAQGNSWVRAVDGVSFQITPGTCFGLLGPNGAGKSTTIEMIEGIKAPTEGEILFRGQPVGEEFKQRAGIQFQATSLPDYLRVGEALQLFSSFYREQVSLSDLARLCALEEIWDRDTQQLSGGQRQRLLLAMALVNDPDILFLDEPTTGLDPQARRNFWELIHSIKKSGKTIVLTTHYMDEAYSLCDEIAIMDRGKIIAQGAPKQLLKTHFDTLTLEIPIPDFRAQIPKSEDFTWPHHERQDQIEIQTRDVNSVLSALLGKGVNLDHLKIRSATLEDLFIELTGRELRDDAL